MRKSHAIAELLFLAGVAAALRCSAAIQPDQAAFFEKSIRPVLVEKCYKCHSAEAEKIKGGLLLDTREGIRQGGDTGHAVVPGDPNESLLLEALHWTNKDLRMPPEKEGGKLPDNVIADFEQWVKMGAPDPRDGESKIVKRTIDPAKAKEEFWAFKLPKAAPAPAVKDSAWPRTEVDRFIRAAQEAKGLKPADDADARTLIRRVYFDLIGLPPTPQQVEAFVRTCPPGDLSTLNVQLSPLLDRLLASTQFGERWGRYWLDVARYAESTGKERNFTFPAAWRYRDYVIASLNADKPYDEFIREQIAGDLLPAHNEAERDEQLIATGFLALGPKGLNEKNREQFRMDLIDEQIDATTRAVTGLTVACARCHDHKFDPITQREYYGLAGIFRSTQTFYGTGGGDAKKNRNGSPLLPLQVASKSDAPPPVVAPQNSAAPNQPANIDALLAKAAAGNPKRLNRLKQMTPAEREAVAQRLLARNGSKPMKNKNGRGQQLEARAAASIENVCMGVSEGNPGDARLLTRGEITEPEETVPRGFVSVLTNGPAPMLPVGQSGRLELARWLTAPSNPLTARVAVNRVWQHLFGEGLVRTPDNFGATGEKPSHPELLDALAVQFTRPVAEGGFGWSIKSLIRALVLSRTYQLASRHDSAATEIDPDNRLLWRASPRRLDAEAIRDAMLAASGQLDLKPLHGSVVASIGDGYIGRGLRPEAFTEAESNKRSVYLPVVRNFVPALLEVFDFAEPSLVVASRDVTNVPSQALYLMNNKFVREQAAAMAKRVLAAPLDFPGRLDLAYQLALGRPATAAERDRAGKYLLDEARALIPVKNGDRDEAAQVSWATFCQALFACAEFRYLR
jgi:cytochrome c553